MAQAAVYRPSNATKTWFETFGEEAEVVRRDLVPDLIRFLEQARVVYDSENEFGVGLSFFYWVQNLVSPDFMFEMLKYAQENEWEKKYLVLYAMNNFTGHLCRLMCVDSTYSSLIWANLLSGRYDQHRHLSIISPTIYDTDEAFEQKV